MSGTNNPDNKLRNLHNALSYNELGEPVLRVIWQDGGGLTTGANVAGTEYVHRIVGMIDIGATGGTLIPNIGFNSNGTGVTVNAQSWIRLTPVSATGANTVIGTWS
jgi:hypothetical protein